MTYVIRQFSTRRPCDTLETLKATLQSEFVGQSVSIQYPRASGMQATLFVDVKEQGLFESYGGQRRLELEEELRPTAT